ncbi:hypothetical protein R5W24_002892 [Gemmata sp. JC717]|uniref:hypothetical protein n=1 Tax=Gemmata algarum TaxID=2975278 RepID=UPI0021BAF193|nr:hypothetical protein [Gemmata algarum]MDY3553778.1 hypothetical protein [Gemmata algarum]
MARRNLSLSETIRTALANPGASLAEALEPWEDTELTLPDAEEFVAVLREQTDVKRLLTPGNGVPLQALAQLFQNEATDDATRFLRDRGTPELVRLFDLAIAVPGVDPEALLTVCKMLAVYVSQPGLERVAAAVRRFPDEYMWEVVFGVYAEDGHPLVGTFIDQLREPLPSDFAAVAFLDLANTAARGGTVTAHPFDTAEGHTRLEAWLADSDADNFSYARSAAAALPFISAAARNTLTALAMDHPDVGVQMEAAQAGASRGGTAGLTFLARLCEDPRYSLAAQQHLRDLDRADRIPPTAAEPDFEAQAVMCDWLAHAGEFTGPPTHIELFDTRELNWVPTDDRRQVWLLRYTYTGLNGDGTDFVGLGMVGSIPAALIGEARADMSPEDVYGLHCCWELEVTDDPRAPDRRSAKAGRELLGI